jgi:two-component system sensor histidine kinase DesK
MPPPISISPQQPRNYAWIWICYTGFLFIEPLFDPSLHLWIATLTVFGIFLSIFVQYVHAVDDGRQTRYWMIAATFLLGLIAFPWNQGASCLFVYTASFLPFTIRSVRRVLWLFAAECLIILGEAWLFHVHRFGLHISLVNAVIAVFLTLVIGGGNIFFAEQKRADCKLRAAQEENITLAAVAERERIARDLHDVLGHTLSVIVLKAELAGRLLNHPTAADPGRAAAEIADVERTARTALAEVREAIGGYPPRASPPKSKPPSACSTPPMSASSSTTNPPPAPASPPPKKPSSPLPFAKRSPTSSATPGPPAAISASSRRRAVAAWW